MVTCILTLEEVASPKLKRNPKKRALIVSYYVSSLLFYYSILGVIFHKAPAFGQACTQMSWEEKPCMRSMCAKNHQVRTKYQEATATNLHVLQSLHCKPSISYLYYLSWSDKCRLGAYSWDQTQRDRAHPGLGARCTLCTHGRAHCRILSAPSSDLLGLHLLWRSDVTKIAPRGQLV